jgi:hypothetical protein
VVARRHLLVLQGTNTAQHSMTQHDTAQIHSAFVRTSCMQAEGSGHPPVSTADAAGTVLGHGWSSGQLQQATGVPVDAAAA